MIQLNGQNGGGQILRTALSLSLITQTPFRMTNIRGLRPKPGLMRQHLTCVQAAAEISNGTADGDHLHSTELVFHPGPIKAGDYTFRIGTAGSTTLLFQTLFPALLMADSESTLELHGGTHNPMAPSADFIDRAFLPQLRKMGVGADFSCPRYGFAPAGGGTITANIQPLREGQNLQPLQLCERGEILSRRVECLLGNIRESVGDRELRATRGGLNPNDWSESDFQLKKTDQLDGSGNALSLEVAFEAATIHITSLGKFGKTSNKVAAQGVKALNSFLKSPAVIEPRLADQLLLPMALSGSGELITISLTNHLKTNIEVIEKFLPVKIKTDDSTPGALRISVQ